VSLTLDFMLTYRVQLNRTDFSHVDIQGQLARVRQSWDTDGIPGTLMAGHFLLWRRSHVILNTWRARGWKASCSLYHLLRETFMTTNTAAMCVPSVEAAPQTHMPRYSGGLTLFLSLSRSVWARESVGNKMHFYRMILSYYHGHKWSDLRRLSCGVEFSLREFHPGLLLCSALPREGENARL